MALFGKKKEEEKKALLAPATLAVPHPKQQKLQTIAVPKQTTAFVVSKY